MIRLKLITEQIDEPLQMIEEAVSEGKQHYLHGIMLQQNLVNKNGRSYPGHVMEGAVNRYIKELVNDNRAYGELGHPPGPAINMDRASHRIVELKKDGDNYIGKAIVMDTPTGNIVRAVHKTGGKLGVSSRGLGTLKENQGCMEVQPDYKIATAADVVHDPSAPDAFVKGIMEGVDWLFEPTTQSWIKEEADNTRKTMRKLTVKQLEERKLAIFEQFIESLLVKDRRI